MFDHQDVLRNLNENSPLQVKLRQVHATLQGRFPWIARVSIAIYDSKTDLLKTFVNSSGGEQPLSLYQAKLANCESLKEILDKGRPRVVNSLESFANRGQEHSERIQAQGYRSSYTMPMYLDGVFFGFLFYNSYEENPFVPEALELLDVYGHLISLLIVGEVRSLHTLLGALETAREVSGQRDSETGTHLDRMARYARLIARELASAHGFDDEHVEQIFMFAPLHDIGKISVPDRVLLKPGKLTPEEYALMQTHVVKGRQFVDSMLSSFGLTHFANTNVLVDIISCHHEVLDGSGYPAGLSGEDIPIEARIVTVSDVFDALTSKRPYKEPWSNDEAFAYLEKAGGRLFDLDCVRALIKNRKEVEEIQATFPEACFGEA